MRIADFYAVFRSPLGWGIGFFVMRAGYPLLGQPKRRVPTGVPWYNTHNTPCNLPFLSRGPYAALLGGEGADLLERKEYPEGTKWSRNAIAVQELERRLEGYGLKGVVFGHVPAAFGIVDNVGYVHAGDHHLIKIDSGMAPEAGGHSGHLLIFPHPNQLVQLESQKVQAESGSVVEGKFVTTVLVEGK